MEGSEKVKLLRSSKLSFSQWLSPFACSEGGIFCNVLRLSGSLTGLREALVSKECSEINSAGRWGEGGCILFHCKQGGKTQPNYSQKRSPAFFRRRDISKWSGTKWSQSVTYNHCMESILAAENRRWLEQVHKWQYLPALSFVSYSLVLFWSLNSRQQLFFRVVGGS